MPETYIEPLTDRQMCFVCRKTVTGKKKLRKCTHCHAITYCGEVCQTEDWVRHSWNCVPVMVTEIEGKGRGLVAARDIKAGELIVMEEPLIKLAKLPPGSLPDLDYFKSLMKQIEEFPEEAKKQFYKLKPRQLQSTKLDVALGALSLGAGMDEFKIFFNNCKVHDKYGYLLHLNTALVNHSCAPNAFNGPVKPGAGVDQSQEILEIRAIKDISKEEEVTIPYIRDLMELGSSSQERRMRIKLRYGFDCKCDVCSGKVDGQDDILRELLEFHQAFRPDHNHKRAYDWRREVKAADKMVDLAMQLYIGDLKAKLDSLEDLVRLAQMAREVDLQKKAKDLWKRMAEDTKLEWVRLNYEEMERDVAQWAARMKAKKLPKKNEIKFFFAE